MNPIVLYFRKYCHCSCVLLFSVLFFFTSPLSAREEAYCNLDPLYRLPDFSDTGYAGRCRANDVARVKNQGVRKFCNPDLPLQVVAIHDNEGSFIFDCSFLDVEKASHSRVYEWKDNQGNRQFTNSPPPADCTTPECKRILAEISKQRNIEVVIDDAIQRYRDEEKKTKAGAKSAQLNHHPTILDYLKNQNSNTLCTQLTSDRKTRNPYISSLRDLYGLDNEELVFTAMIFELSERFKTEIHEVERLYQRPQSIWVGMNEDMLNCSRPNPELIYNGKNTFGVHKKQYVYEIKPNYEYVDLYSGKVINITTDPIPK